MLAGSWNDSWPAAPRLPRLWHPDIKYFNVKHTTKPCKRGFTIATQALSLRRRKRIREAFMYKCIIQVFGYAGELCGRMGYLGVAGGNMVFRGPRGG